MEMTRMSKRRERRWKRGGIDCMAVKQDRLKKVIERAKL